MPRNIEKFLTPAETLKAIAENSKSNEATGEPLPIPMALANNIKAPPFKKSGLNYCKLKKKTKFIQFFLSFFCLVIPNDHFSLFPIRRYVIVPLQNLQYGSQTEHTLPVSIYTFAAGLSWIEFNWYSLIYFFFLWCFLRSELKPNLHLRLDNPAINLNAM